MNQTMILTQTLLYFRSQIFAFYRRHSPCRPPSKSGSRLGRCYCDRSVRHLRDQEGALLPSLGRVSQPGRPRPNGGGGHRSPPGAPEPLEDFRHFQGLGGRQRRLCHRRRTCPRLQLRKFCRGTAHSKRRQRYIGESLEVGSPSTFTTTLLAGIREIRSNAKAVK